MEAREWTDLDRISWGPGDWDGEPDKVQWSDEATGLPCLIVRSQMGALCGYVGIPDTHPWHGVDYQNCTSDCGEGYCDHRPDVVIEVHGGITFADTGRDCGRMSTPNVPDDLWWFGFDCAHAGDLCPSYIDMSSPFRIFSDALGDMSGDGTYKDVAYVKVEIASLALQLNAVIG